ncbi:MAG: hypothetical protein L0H12_00695, partial [Nitrosospira sp.]|nr:hypothetical protein [Nitrosospira sp.]
MRASILISIAAFTLVLAACNETQSGRQAEGPPGNEAVASPVGANDTSATIAGGQKRDWSSLDALIGKYPRKSGLLDNSVISDDLRKLLGPKFDVFKMNLETQAPLQRDKSVLFLYGNKDNQGGSDAAYLLIDT